LNNNNRNNNNNRRRGRGNNNRQQGGGQQLNRVDSRARGNAPQLLEKYRKLAHDAHLNGDRVTEEYYLQFADHYFRVISDTRVRQEEQRSKRDDRWQEGGEGQREDSEEQGEYAVETDDYGYETQPRREDRPRYEERPRFEDRPRQVQDDRPRQEERPSQNERPRYEDRSARDPDGEQDVAEGAEQATPYEPAENPFTRDARPTRGLRPRRDDRRPRRDDREPRDNRAPEFDASILPPAISTVSESAPPEDVAAEPAKRPRGRPRKVQPPADDAGAGLETVG
jgi:Domain of unknown function (DUF4167)